MLHITGKRSITPDTAFRPTQFFSTTPDFRLNLQQNVDIWDALQANRFVYG
ncbi:MAG: helix-turn-helix domain-containing protein [Candidatus Latescibacterota bacterium]